MKPIHWLFFAFSLFGLLMLGPMLMAQGSDQAEIGAFVDYFHFTQFSPSRNFVGLGGRAAINFRPSVQLEAEMAYDFKRSFTRTFTNGLTTQLVNTDFRTLHGLFGPKLQTGSGPARIFVTGKVGFDNFSISNKNAPAGFTSAVGLTNGTTDFAVYPAAGIELFGGFIGLRAEIGDEIYFDHGGSHHNVRATLGPQLRF
jgi:hypothetical protein